MSFANRRPTNSNAHVPINTTEIEARPVTPAEPAEPWLTPGRFAVFLGLLIIATFPGVVSGARAFIVRDFGLFAYPLAFYQRQCFWRGELPLWNPLSHCGIPYLAQWNTITLYPGSLIYLLLPLPWSVSFFCLAHLFWGGLGMYFLACRWTNHRLAAALAGVIFCFNGLALNFLMWTNVSATYGWLPWVLLLVQVGWREGGRKLVWATLASAMQLLAGSPEVVLLTWFILFLLACGEWCRREQPRRDLVLRFCGIVLLVAAICAVQLLPFLQLLSHSLRSSRFSSISENWSIPIWGWANFLAPLFRAAPRSQGVFSQPGQGWTSSYYAGIGTLLLAAAAVRRRQDWRVRLLAVVFVLGSWLALGDEGLLFRAMRTCFPAVGFVRFPVKFVVLTLAVAPLLAAFGLEALASKTRRLGLFEWVCTFILLLLIALLAALDWKFPISDDLWRFYSRNALARAGFLVLIFLVIMGFLRAQERRRILLGILLLVIFWLDGATHSPRQNPTVQPSVYSPGWARAQLKLDNEARPNPARIMLGAIAEETLRLHRLRDVEQCYLIDRLAFLDDCNLLDDVPQTLGFFALLPEAINNVTLLPVIYTNRDFPALLDFMGVAQTTAPGTLCQWTNRPTALPLVTAGQRPVFADDRTAFSALFDNTTDFRQAVFLPLAARNTLSATQHTTACVSAVKFANQSVSLQTEAPGAAMIVISQTFYPGWRAYVDGRPEKIWCANYAFQALQVPPGHHQVTLVYEDKAFLFGALLSGLGVAACLGLWLLTSDRNRHPFPPSCAPLSGIENSHSITT